MIRQDDITYIGSRTCAVANALTVVQKNSKTKCWLEGDGGPILESRELWPSSTGRGGFHHPSWGELTSESTLKGIWWQLADSFHSFSVHDRVHLALQMFANGSPPKVQGAHFPLHYPHSLFHLEKLYFSKCISYEHLINKQGATEFITSMHLNLTR